MPLTPSQQKALALAPRVSGPLSMFGSFCIIRLVLLGKDKRSMTYQKLMFGMSCCDFITSLWHSLSTLPIPIGTPNVWGASGNTDVCTAQGFFLQFGLATPIYNASLSIYYLLVGRYNWNEERVRKAQPLFHGVPLFIGLSTSLSSIPLKLFNNANLWCWIAPFPLGCKDSRRFPQEADCERGDNAWIYRWVFFYLPLWTSIFIAMAAMALVYWTVLQHERVSERPQSNATQRGKHSRRVASQSFWYIVAFWVSWAPATLTRIFQFRGETFYLLILAMAIFTPLQGFTNFLVYTRARYLKYRRENTKISRRHAMIHAAFCASVENKQNIIVNKADTTTVKFGAPKTKNACLSRISELPSEMERGS